MPSAYLPLKRSSFIFLFHANGERELYQIPEKPNGFGDYRQAFTYILSHPEIPDNAGVVEVYTRG